MSRSMEKATSFGTDTFGETRHCIGSDRAYRARQRHLKPEGAASEGRRPAAWQARLAACPSDQCLTGTLQSAPVEEVRERDGRPSPARPGQRAERREDHLRLGEVNTPVFAAVAAVPPKGRTAVSSG